MAKRSAIEQLPGEVRRWLERALADNGYGGYAQLEAALAEQGYQISKSAIHRYGQKIESRLKAIKDSAEIAKLITDAVDDEGDSQSDALLRLVQTDLMNLLIDAREVAELDVKDRLKLLSNIGRNVAAMTAASLRLKQHQVQTRERLTQALDRMAAEGGTGNDAATLERVRAQVMAVYGLG